MSSERIKQEYPLHWFVWHNDFIELQNILDLNRVSFFTYIISVYMFLFIKIAVHACFV